MKRTSKPLSFDNANFHDSFISVEGGPNGRMSVDELCSRCQCRAGVHRIYSRTCTKCNCMKLTYDRFEKMIRGLNDVDTR